MRVAIAAEAWNIGLPIERALQLFKDQPDFNIDVTRKKVEDTIPGATIDIIVILYGINVALSFHRTVLTVVILGRRALFTFLTIGFIPCFYGRQSKGALL